MTEEVERLIIRCTRIVDMPVAPVASDREQCDACGRDIWVSHQTIALAQRHHPDVAYGAMCVQCKDDDIHDVVHLPEQVTDLRRQGVPDRIIAQTLATAEVTDGMTLVEAAAEVIANPRGVRAMAYRAALVRTEAFVRSVPR